MTFTLTQIVNLVAATGFCGHAIAKGSPTFAAFFAFIAAAQVASVVLGGCRMTCTNVRQARQTASTCTHMATFLQVAP